MENEQNKTFKINDKWNTKENFHIHLIVIVRFAK